MNDFDRAPSCVIKLAPRDRCRTGIPKGHWVGGTQTWEGMFAAARKAHSIAEGLELGLVYATRERAWFQIWGDKTPYSIAITNFERALFTFTSDEELRRHGLIK